MIYYKNNNHTNKKTIDFLLDFNRFFFAAYNNTCTDCRCVERETAETVLSVRICIENCKVTYSECRLRQ